MQQLTVSSRNGNTFTVPVNSSAFKFVEFTGNAATPTTRGEHMNLRADAVPTVGGFRAVIMLHDDYHRTPDGGATVVWESADVWGTHERARDAATAHLRVGLAWLFS